jgi:hypothetical protein
LNALNGEGHAPQVLARHLSWSDVLKTVNELKATKSLESATGLLLHQLDGYLRHLGYFYLEGSIVTQLQRYGRLLSELHRVKNETEAQLIACLDCLCEAMISAPEAMPLAWTKKNFGRTAVSNQRVHFTFLTAPLDGLDGAHYRVLPSMKTDGELSLTVYLTYNHRGRDVDELAIWLSEHARDIEADFTSLTKCGPLSSDKPYVFHISRRLDGEAANAFFGGDEASLAKLGVEFNAFFRRAQTWVDRGLSAQSSDD